MRHLMRHTLPRLLLPVVLMAASSTQADWRDFLDKARDRLSGDTTTEQNPQLSEAEISDGLREALAVGADRAIRLLGRSGGYLDDPQVHIPLPGMLDTAAKGLRLIGQDELVDDFETTLNRAAEQAIPRTLDIVRDTVKGMTLKDARDILTGPDDSATRYLRDKAGDSLYQAIRPIVADATERAGATAAYKRFAAKAGAGSRLNTLLSSQQLDLDDYVTRKALDGLFLKLADEERLIREDPLARSTELLKKVFGS